MMGVDESRIKDGKKVPDGFTYDSENNDEWMTKDQLKEWLDANIDFIGIE